MGTYIILKGILIHGIPTVHYGTVKSLLEQKQIQITQTTTGQVLNSHTVNKSASPWCLVAPAQSSLQLGHQTSAPCPALLSVPDLCRAALGAPGTDTAASVWEGRGSRRGTLVWALVGVVVVVEAAGLQTEGDRQGPLWSHVRQDLWHRCMLRYSLKEAFTFLHQFIFLMRITRI